MSERAAYRPDIDGLRAVAIITVVAFHAGVTGMRGGFLGVDVFFVISGFLITQILAQEGLSSGRIALGRFYARRVRRLMPAFLLTLVTTMAVATVLLDPGGRERQQLAKSAIAALFVHANNYFLGSTGYFDGQHQSAPLLHTWSLSVEEQFYLVWPVLLAIGCRFIPRKSLLTVVTGALVVAWLASFGMMCWRLGADQADAAFYLMTSRAWELATGGLLALWIMRNPTAANPARSDAIAALGLAAVIFSVFWFDSTSPFPLMTLVPTLGTAAVIYGNTSGRAGVAVRLLSTKPMVAVGLVSYGWYLWHWPLLVFARTVWGPSWRDLLVVLAAFALSRLSFSVLEYPARRRWVMGARPSRVLATGLGAILCVTACAGALGYWSRASARPTPLSIALDDHMQNREQCFLGIGQDQAPPECLVTPGDGKRLLVVWGDSHAEAWMPLAQALSEQQGRIGVLQLTKAGCPPLVGLVPRMFGRPVDPGCRTFNDNVVADLKRLTGAGKQVGVLLVARWSTYTATPRVSVADLGLDYFDLSAQTPQESVARMRVGFQATLDALRAVRAPAILLLPVPELRYFAPDCLLRWHRPDSACSVDRDVYLQQRALAVDGLLDISRNRDDIRVIDPADYFCDSARCHAERGGTVMYYDDDHVSATAARKMTTFAAGELSWLVGRSFAGTSLLPDGATLMEKR